MKVLVIAPHPDDECIGMGGTLYKHVVEGDYVTVLHVTSGELGVNCPECTTEDDIKQFKRDVAHIREIEAGVCSQILQYQNAVILDHYADGGGDLENSSQPWEVSRLQNELLRHIERNNRVYCPSVYDNHVDHKMTAFCAIAARGLSANPPPIWFYEVWTPIQDPDVFVDISEYASVKRGAIRCHKSQLSNSFDEAILSLNHYRGLLYGPNKLYIEAFKTFGE